SVRAVHIMFWMKGILVSGCWTSGRNGTNGLTRSRNRTREASRALASCRRRSMAARRVAIVGRETGQRARVGAQGSSRARIVAPSIHPSAQQQEQQLTGTHLGGWRDKTRRL